MHMIISKGIRRNTLNRNKLNMKWIPGGATLAWKKKDAVSPIRFKSFIIILTFLTWPVMPEPVA
jgi:hypothetical protein